LADSTYCVIIMPLLNIGNKVTNDSVPPAEYNLIIAAINSISDSLDVQILKLNNVQSKTNSFLPTIGSGLSVNVAGGVIKRVSDGILLNIAPQVLFVPASVTNRWCWLDRNGVAQTGLTLPAESYELCQVTTSASVVSSITDMRSNSFELKQRQLRTIVKLVKNGVLAIATTGTTINGWVVPSDGGVNENTVMNLTTGIFTPTVTTQYRITTRVQIANTSRGDSGKLSLFVGGTELRILDTTERSIMQGVYQGSLSANSTVFLQATSGSGSPGSILSNNNTELLIEMLG
jgi:hypothetical protein